MFLNLGLSFLVLIFTACTPKRTVELTTQEKFNEAIKHMSSEAMKNEIIYGKDLIDNTAAYIGPQGSVKKITGNNLSCKNCHLDSGMRPYALPFTDSHGLYPQYRSREGKILTLAERINSCIKMPLKGTRLEEGSREMQAMLLYIRFLGSGRPILTKDQDDRLMEINYPDRAASPQRGKALYAQHCTQCHQENGQGIANEKNNGYVYPPLWGSESYRSGSSMNRVSIFARFIKANMPFEETNSSKPVLSDEEALDIAAFVNSENLNPRPKAPEDIYPNIALKPFDAPMGPFTDPFPPEQHKFGPFKPILSYRQDSQPELRQLTDGDLNSP